MLHWDLVLLKRGTTNERRFLVATVRMGRIHNYKEKDMLMLAQIEGNPSTFIHKKSSKTFYFQSRSISRLILVKSKWLFIKETLYFK